MFSNLPSYANTNTFSGLVPGTWFNGGGGGDATIQFWNKYLIQFYWWLLMHSIYELIACLFWCVMQYLYDNSVSSKKYFCCFFVLFYTCHVWLDNHDKLKVFFCCFSNERLLFVAFSTTFILYWWISKYYLRQQDFWRWPLHSGKATQILVTKSWRLAENDVSVFCTRGRSN